MMRRLRSRCRPHPSGTQSVALNLAKTAVQIVVFWSFFLYLVPTVIVAVERNVGFPRFQPLPLAGWLLFTAMGAIGLYSGTIFAVRGGGTPLPLDTTTQFIVLGPYRYIRNPMAVAGTVQGVAVGLILGSLLVIAYSVAGMILWHVFARPWEEEDLAERFGEPYEEYRRRVRCWIPRLKPYPAVHGQSENPSLPSQQVP